ncbi:glycoside hydrolase family 16 protein [uncultured Fibrobacter sp.]|uniref:glycoside hydrolase family 16 protein n=1 Tax=uncultured Fibrobacter sp. TaxID=261512 RepID=UPI0025D6FD2E|nr:glycoside hydrolase family 16 protein [uncultured Fibrobacter sp.]
MRHKIFRAIFNITATATIVATVILAACTSDSSSSGPAEEPPACSSSYIDTPAEPESSSSATEPKFSSVTLQSSSSDKVTEPVEVTSSSRSSPYLWHDEFDFVDTTQWSFETGASGWGNNEWQYYTNRSENAFVQDGVLHIRANKEDYEGAQYTSARMTTKGKFSFTYGTIEARIALPTGNGIWPAFWMLGENIDAVSWPACGEIDIIEAVNDENVVYGTNHWQYEGGHAQYGNNTKDYYGTSKVLDITQFHNYKMVWNEKLIAMYVDDFKYQEIAIENAKDGLEAFHKPQFLILNVAVAGNWPGFDVDDAQFPNEMLVDYIRVLK